MANPILRYALAVDPRSEQRARYAIELLCEGLGLPCAAADTHSADLVYGYCRPAGSRPAAVWIPAEPLERWDETQASCHERDSLALLYPQTATSRTANSAAGDILLSTYLVVSGAFEQHDQRDAWGIIKGRGCALDRLAVLQRPLIPEYCRHLRQLLNEADFSHPGIDRWPHGKRFAVVVSHDVDVPFSRPTAAFQARRLARDCQRRSWQSAWRKLLSLSKTLALRVVRSRGDLKNDPNFCFEQWHSLLSKLQAKSCFYVATVSSADPGSSKDDVNYDFGHPILVEAMRRTIDTGFEIGLHASINARTESGRIAAEKQRLESVLQGYRVRGVRHHYWSLDGELPERTLRLHADAGFEYDSSLGLNDSPGFRRGMCWPFVPFDRERGIAAAIREIPPTLMDGAIFAAPISPRDGEDQIKSHFDVVAQAGGAVVLDWHQEQLNSNRLHGAGPAIERVLLDLAENSEVFWASPVELHDWWTARREQIAALAR